MNLLDHYVTEVIGEPYYDDFGSGKFHWWLDVNAVCEGYPSMATLMFDCKEDALKVGIGYKFLV